LCHRLSRLGTCTSWDLSEGNERGEGTGDKNKTKINLYGQCEPFSFMFKREEVKKEVKKREKKKEEGKEEKER
jgi:hypothetical protein